MEAMSRTRILLRCPACGSLLLDGCDLCRGQEEGVLDLVPPALLRDPVRRAETGRYDGMAAGGADLYRGYPATRPQVRARLVRAMLEGMGADAFVEVGPGFGDLLAATPGFERVAIDHSLPFLEIVRARTPEVRCVRGLADRLPLAWTPALVADGLFQTLPYPEAFLCETARVTDLFIMSVGFRHNYPRRPQHGFDVRKADERRALVRFLEELGFTVELRWTDVVGERRVRSQRRADYLYILGAKR